MATPAEPRLASSILLAQRRAGEDVATVTLSRGQKIATGHRALDDALNGGLLCGQVHAITSEPDRGTREVVQALLVTHLRSHEDATAVMVDSTNSLDLQRLHRAMTTSHAGREDAAHQAMKMLDRLEIMKVFDFIGLTEAVAEVRDTLDGGSKSIATTSAPRAPRHHMVPDSEDEEDEMLDTPPDHPPPPREVSSRPNETPTRPASRKEPGLRLLVIDNISQVMMPLFKNDYTHGQALLSSFMRSLLHLTASNHLCTVLVANAANVKAAEGEETLSLFRSCAIRSVFGPGFGHLLDVHFLLHTLPGREPRDQSRPGGRRSVSVLEVVQDRHGGRFGRWAPFAFDSDGQLKDVR